MGELDLRGTGYLTFEASASSQMGSNLSAPLVFEHEGERRTVDLRFEPGANPFTRVPALIGYLVVIVALLIRAPPSRTTRALCCAILVMTCMQMPRRSLSWVGSRLKKTRRYPSIASGKFSLA